MSAVSFEPCERCWDHGSGSRGKVACPCCVGTGLVREGESSEHRGCQILTHRGYACAIRTREAMGDEVRR